MTAFSIARRRDFGPCAYHPLTMTNIPNQTAVKREPETWLFCGFAKSATWLVGGRSSWARTWDPLIKSKRDQRDAKRH